MAAHNLTPPERDALHASSQAIVENTLPVVDSSQLNDWFEQLWHPGRAYPHAPALASEPTPFIRRRGIGLPAADAPSNVRLRGEYQVAIAPTFEAHARSLDHTAQDQLRNTALRLCLTSPHGFAKIAEAASGYAETWIHQQDQNRLVFQLIKQRKQLVLLSYRRVDPPIPTVERSKAVPYTAEISRSNPSCILFLIDQSGSMDETMKSGKTKAQSLADAINRLLYELILRSTKTDGVRDFYEVGVIGYGKHVGSAFIGELKGQSLVPLSVLADNPANVEMRSEQVEDGNGGTRTESKRFLVWIEPVHDNGTPMGEAFYYARTVLQPWVEQHPRSFPPIVINITDGEANDDKDRYIPTREAEALCRLATNDGEVLLFNLQFGSSGGRVVQFPEHVSEVKNPYAQELFSMSSQLPAYLQEALERAEYDVGPASRGFVYNADMLKVITFLDIGTRPRAPQTDR